MIRGDKRIGRIMHNGKEIEFIFVGDQRVYGDIKLPYYYNNGQYISAGTEGRPYGIVVLKSDDPYSRNVVFANHNSNLSMYTPDGYELLESTQPFGTSPQTLTGLVQLDNGNLLVMSILGSYGVVRPDIKTVVSTMNNDSGFSYFFKEGITTKLSNGNVFIADRTDYGIISSTGTSMIKTATEIPNQKNINFVYELDNETVLLGQDDRTITILSLEGEVISTRQFTVFNTGNFYTAVKTFNGDLLISGGDDTQKDGPESEGYSLLLDPTATRQLKTIYYDTGLNNNKVYIKESALLDDGKILLVHSNGSVTILKRYNLEIEQLVFGYIIDDARWNRGGIDINTKLVRLETGEFIAGHDYGYALYSGVYIRQILKESNILNPNNERYQYAKGAVVLDNKNIFYIIGNSYAILTPDGQTIVSKVDDVIEARNTGVLVVEPNVRAVIKLDNGNIWIAGFNNYIILSPSGLTELYDGRVTTAHSSSNPVLFQKAGDGTFFVLYGDGYIQQFDETGRNVIERRKWIRPDGQEFSPWQFLELSNGRVGFRDHDGVFLYTGKESTN